MSDLVEKVAMAQAEGAFAYTAERLGPAPISAARDEAGMKAALLYLADNVSDEMVNAATRALYGPANERCTPGAPAIIISAALRAAAGSAPPEVK